MPTQTAPPTFDQAIQRIKLKDPLIHAFLSTRIDEASKEFESQKNLAGLKRETPQSPLHGLPFSLKDVWEVKDTITTAGSFRHRNRISQFDSKIFQIFSKAGAILLGKTNCSDLSISPETVNYIAGYTANPFDLNRTAGGSSGGAAAAVATGMTAFDWGTDIGGSIRIPAAFCGVFGLKLSTTTWPRHGDFPEPPPCISFMNGQGPITPNIDVLRKVLAQAAPEMRIAPKKHFLFTGLVFYPLDKASTGMWLEFQEEVSKKLVSLGLNTQTAPELPPLGKARILYASLWASHLFDLIACDNLGLAEGLIAVIKALLFRGRLGDKRFHPTSARLILLMTFGRFTFFRNSKKALKGAALLRESLEKRWDLGQVIILPTCTESAPLRGKLLSNWNILNCILPGNIADATALAFPFGNFPDGMPRSLQLLGPPGSELALIDLAEKITVPSVPTP